MELNRSLRPPNYPTCRYFGAGPYKPDGPSVFRSLYRKRGDVKMAVLPILEVLVNVIIQIAVKTPPMLLIIAGAGFHLLADPIGMTLIQWGIVLQVLWIFRPIIMKML